MRRLTGVLEPSCGDSSNNEIEAHKRRSNFSNVYMDASNACCMPCKKMQHQSSLPSSPLSAFFHLSFNEEDDSHSSEEELEKINSKGMFKNFIINHSWLKRDYDESFHKGSIQGK